MVGGFGREKGRVVGKEEGEKEARGGRHKKLDKIFVKIGRHTHTH